MKIKLNHLSPKEKALLADFYESEYYKIFKKHFIENGQILLAQNGVISPDWDGVNQHKGAIVVLKNIHEELRRISKEENKNRS
jgi:hypothetical protein